MKRPNEEDHHDKALRDHVYVSLNNYFTLLEEQDPKHLYEMFLGEVEYPLFQYVMEYTKNNQTHAAKILGMSRNTLRKKLTIYNLDE